MEDKIRIICLGGQDERGKNLFVVEINEDIFVVECGLKFPDKTKLGIDYIIPRFDYLIEHKDKVKGYFISKGHDAVLGGLPYIYKRIPAPVYCTDMASMFIKSFCEHNHIKVDFDFRLVQPSDEIKIDGRIIRFFPVCCNVARSYAIAINTDKGNIVINDDFVIDNNSDERYLSNSKMLSRVAEEQTLMLMLNSNYAERTGYTNPKYKLSDLCEQTFKDAPGRIFIAIESPEIYNIEQIIKLAIRKNRKVIAYDKTTEEFIKQVMYDYGKDFMAPVDDVNRIAATDVLVIISGFGSRLFHKVCLLASGNNEDKRFKLHSKDTFIIGIHNDSKNEVDFSDTVNELYKTDVENIIYFKKDQFLKMHPSQEDLKTTLAIFKPKYYLPIGGNFRELLANARMAVDMGIGLNHMNVFVVDNGMIVSIDEKGARVCAEKAPSGDLLVDGRGVGDIDNSLVAERTSLAVDGVIVLGATVSLLERKIIAGPDIQTRGLVFVKESEPLLKEINRVFVQIIENELKAPIPSKKAIEDQTRDLILKVTRRMILKSPMILPIIVEIDK